MTAERLSEPPTRVYDPQPIIVGHGQALSPAQGYTQPQIIVMQQAAPEQSWLKAHSGELVAGGAAGVIVIGLLLAVAVVAIAVAVGAVSVAGAWIVIKGMAGQQTKK